MLYYKYSEYLKQRYGEKVYKLPVSLPVSCPNRDGRLGSGGCSFCGANGAAHEALDAALPVREQLLRNRDYIGKKYGAQKYLAYFQDYTSTYTDVAQFDHWLEECAQVQQIVGVVASTRPDCLTNEMLGTFSEFRTRSGLDIYLELGLQTANWHTLAAVNRGHGLAEFVDAVLRSQRNAIEICAHVIANLPGDDMTDVIETARLLTALQVKQVKLHALYIARGSKLAAEYIAGRFVPGSRDEYIERVVAFLRNLSGDIAVQRLIGRVPERDALFANWGESWWKIHESIERRMQENGYCQGDQADFVMR